MTKNPLELPDDDEQAEAVQAKASESLLARALGRKRRTETVKFADDPAAAVRLGKARQALLGARDELARAEKTWHDDDSATARRIVDEARDAVTVAEAAVNEIIAALGDDVWIFEFASIGAQAREKLNAEYPATTEQIDEAKAMQQLAARGNRPIPGLPVADGEAIALPLIAACMVSVTVGGVKHPPFTVDALRSMWSPEAQGAWTEPDKQMLLHAALACDVTGSGVDLESVGKG